MIKCAECGKFINYKDFQDSKVAMNYVPLSEYTKEEIEHKHIGCVKKN